MARVLCKDMSESTTPYATLGTHLKYLREQSSESLAEVSGAVEIDEEHLSRIEAGTERPAEDILLLLISHFNMQDQEAVQLWELAGYDGEVPDQIRPSDVLTQGGKSIVMLLAFDTRTVYTDGIEVVSTPAGLTMNFTQASNQKEPLGVARLGMSLEQAEQVLRALNHGIAAARFNKQPKALPPETDCPHDSHEH